MSVANRPPKKFSFKKEEEIIKEIVEKNKSPIRKQKILVEFYTKKYRMACRIALRAVFLTEPWLPFPFFNKLSTFTPVKKISTPNLSCGCKTALNSKSYQFSSNCSNKGDSSPSSDDSEQGPPQEAVLKAISGLSFSAQPSYSINVAHFVLLETIVFVNLVMAQLWNGLYDDGDC